MYQYVIESNLNLQINYFLWIIIQIRTFPGLEKSANWRWYEIRILMYRNKAENYINSCSFYLFEMKKFNRKRSRKFQNIESILSFFNPDFKPNVITALFVCIQQTVIGMTSVLSKMKTIMNRQNICTCCCYSISQVPSYIFFALVPKRLWSCWLQETVCMYVCLKPWNFTFCHLWRLIKFVFHLQKKIYKLGIMVYKYIWWSILLIQPYSTMYWYIIVISWKPETTALIKTTWLSAGSSLSLCWKKNSWHQAIRVDIKKYVKFFTAFF